MDTARFWKFVAVRAVWFMAATVATLLAIVLGLQMVVGNRSGAVGTDYSATIVSKSTLQMPGDDGAVCRVTVVPDSAPDASDAPSRIRSSTDCAQLPAIGAQLPLTYVNDGATVVTTEDAAAADGSPVPGMLVLLLAVAGWAMFVRESRRLKRAIDDGASEGTD